jgi:hypothetical protein
MVVSHDGDGGSVGCGVKVCKRALQQVEIQRHRVDPVSQHLLISAGPVPRTRPAYPSAASARQASGAVTATSTVACEAAGTASGGHACASVCRRDAGSTRGEALASAGTGGEETWLASCTRNSVRATRSRIRARHAMLAGCTRTERGVLV